MTPNKLPPLPEPTDDDLPVPIAYGMRRKGEISVIGVIPSKVHENPATSEAYLREFEEVPLFTDGQLYAAREQAFHDGQCEALRQSQSLPAGAVASVISDIRSHCNPPNPDSDDEVSPSYALSWADRLEQALQADAREKGEAVAWRSKDYQPWLSGGFAWAYTHNAADVGPQHEALYLATPDYVDAIILLEKQRDLVENLRGQLSDRNDDVRERANEIELSIAAGKLSAHQVFTQMRQLIATHPAQASEAKPVKWQFRTFGHSGWHGWQDCSQGFAEQFANERYHEFRGLYPAALATSSQETASE